MRSELTSDLRDRVRAAISELLEVTLDPTYDDQLLAEMHPRYDSLAVLDAVGRVEQVFNVAIDLVDDDLRTTFASIASIAALVDRKLTDRATLEDQF
jgi:acyl carrier protein